MNLPQLEQVVEFLKKYRRIVVVSILERHGSSPVPNQALLAVSAQSAVGTIGGGMLEATAITQARRLLATDHADIISFSMDRDSAAEEGMLCGGSVRLLLEPVHGDDITCWISALEVVGHGMDGLFVVRIQQEENRIMATRQWVMRSDMKTLGDLREDAKGCMRKRSACTISRGEATYLFDPLTLPDTLLIFGAGHVAKALVPVVTSIGFSCWVIDDRQSFACPERFPEAHRTFVAPPSNAVGSLPHGDDIWAVVMTRGHQHDARVLGELLQRNYRYVGMIGSERKKTTIFRDLARAGTPPDLLRTVHCPIGLPLGGSTPAEIAISIAAELIVERYMSKSEQPLRRYLKNH